MMGYATYSRYLDLEEAKPKVLCMAHDGVHVEVAGCKQAHYVAPSGRTWADGRYGS